MKSIFLSVIFLLFPIAKTFATTPEPELCLLKVHATGFRNEKGSADAAVFASAVDWPEGHKDFAHDASPISHGQSTISFHVPPGRYGVVVLHDENMNYKMDRDFLGIPKEGFGFSENPHVVLTAPSFRQASFQVTCPATSINVKIIYK